MATDVAPTRAETALRTLERPIFLAGRGRSGTSLLTRLFEDHPQIFSMFGETRVFTEIVPRLRETGDRVAAAEAIALRFPIRASQTDKRLTAQVEALDLDDPALARAVFRIGLERWSRKHNPKQAVAFLEKTPKNEEHLEALFAAFPNAKVLYLLRDPRALYISNSRSPLPRMAPDFIARQWVKSVRRVLTYVAAREAQSSIRVVRFESLVTDPRATLTPVCDFLGLDWSDTLLQPTMRGRPWDGNSYDPEKLTPDGVSAAKAGEWREELSPADRGAIEAVAGFEMSLLGYLD